MPKNRILAVVDILAEEGGICEKLRKSFTLRCTQTLRPTLQQISDFDPELILIDFDASTPGKARRITQAAKAHFLRPFIILIKSGRSAPQNITYYDQILTRPFVSGRLKSAINKLLASRPDYVITDPPFTLDRRTQVMVTPKGTVRLNPKLSKLAEIFLMHPGEIITPMMLMNEVWKTEFYEDIRTLHVHIHWLREVLEENTSNPQFLQTVTKNRGYRMNLPGPVTIGGEPLYVKTAPSFPTA